MVDARPDPEKAMVCMWLHSICKILEPLLKFLEQQKHIRARTGQQICELLIPLIGEDIYLRCYWRKLDNDA